MTRTDFQAIFDRILHLQSELRGANIGGSFVFELQAHGRCQDTGNVRVEFALAKDYVGDSSTVKGNDLEPVLDEFLRRYGWAKANQPLMLTHESAPKNDDDEIPF